MEQLSRGRVAALDGIRGLCILLVLFAHAAGTGVLPITTASRWAADIGVRGFFVLSGFLITSLLMHDRQPIAAALRGFYLRRAFRIFPAFYCFLAGVAVLSMFGITEWSSNDAIYAATYTMNFHAERGWSLGHLWSLAVEEQFYLVWPAVFLLVRPERRVSVLCAALLVAPLARVGCWYLTPEYRALADQAFPCVFDSLAAGCLLALLRERLERLYWYRLALLSPYFWPAIALSVATLAITRPWFQLGIASTLANIAIALFIHACLTVREAARRILELRVLTRIGVLSYSLYLWQQVFVNRHASAWFNRFPVNLVLACAAALASYHLVETRFLRFSARYRAR